MEDAHEVLDRQLGVDPVRPQRVEPNRPFAVGRIDDDYLAGALGWDETHRLFGEVLFRVDEQHSPPLGEVVGDEIGHQRRLPGAGWTVDGEVSQPGLEVHRSGAGTPGFSAVADDTPDAGNLGRDRERSAS